MTEDVKRTIIPHGLDRPVCSSPSSPGTWFWEGIEGRRHVALIFIASRAGIPSGSVKKFIRSPPMERSCRPLFVYGLGAGFMNS